MDSLDNMKQQQAYIERQVRGWERVGKLHAEMMKEIEALTAEKQPTDIPVKLPKEMKRVFEMMCQGLSNSEMTEKKGCDKKTIDATLQNIKKKLNFPNMYALREFAKSYRIKN